MPKLSRRLDCGPLGTGRDRDPDIAPASAVSGQTVR